MTNPEQGPAVGADDGADRRVCQFPVAYDPGSGEFAVAGHPLPPAPPGRGRKAEYCGEFHVDPDGVRRRHDRAAAFQRKRELQLEAAGGATARPDRPVPRPVTSARASLAELLAQWEMVTTAHRAQQAEIVDRVAEIVATAGDPDAAVAEVARIRAEAQAEIDAARAAAAEAENEALSARRELARAIEDKTLAEGAAEDAIADRDARAAEAAAEVDQARAEAATVIEQARADVAAAHAELEHALTDARSRIAAAEQAAAERVHAIRTETATEIEQIQAAANEQIRAAETRVRAASKAQRDAEAERAGAEQAAADARTEAQQLRRDLEVARAELTELTQAARAEREQLRSELASARGRGAARPAPKGPPHPPRGPPAPPPDREQMRTDHAAELARTQEAANAQVAALRQALDTAHSTISRLEDEMARRKGEQK
ncbi:hypothetical protein [Nocardia farcinica]|uniref:hypothetical protein n=1 Tax=Nocardia farcinica TaxID=37329 RepID=UPI00245627DF|nr:hypothetical protein [Nocardia farcinica]